MLIDINNISAWNIITYDLHPELSLTYSKILKPVGVDSDSFLSEDETNTFVPKCPWFCCIFRTNEPTTDGQLTNNVDKCTEVVDVVSPLQQLDLKEIATQGKS